MSWLSPRTDFVSRIESGIRSPVKFIGYRCPRPSMTACVIAVSQFGCSAQTTVAVDIRPTGYAVGTVASKSATDATDEVIRLKPEIVLIRVCTETPPALVNQLQMELEARTNVELKVSVSERCGS